MKILYLGNKLSEKGYTPTGIETMGPLLEQEGYEMHYASNKTNKVSRFIDIVFSIIRHSSKVDVVLIDTYSTSAFYYTLASAMLCRTLNLKYIPILRGGNLPQRLSTSSSLCRMIFQNSFNNVVLSSYMQQAMNKAGYNNTLIPNSISITQYPFKLEKRNNRKLLWVRSFHKIYNPEMAIKVINELSKTYPDISLKMVGPDKDGTMLACKELAKQLNVADQITFTGQLSKKEWIALSADHGIFINTSDIDNMPLSIIEAMALGLPVVSTNAGGITALIKDGGNGLLVDRNNIVEMCSAVSGIIDNSTEIEMLIQNARKNAEQFDWNMVKHSWNKLLRSAV